MKYPKQSKYGIPHFSSFACSGDTVTWKPSRGNPAGLMLTATLHLDEDTNPTDFECHSKKKIKEWHNGGWSYVCVVISVSRNGIMLDNRAVALWGVECNYNERSNLYFAQVCKELESEALAAGNEVLSKLKGE